MNSRIIYLGIDTQKIHSMFGSDWKIVRAMPNTAVTVGEGATVYCLGNGAEQSDSIFVQKLFSSIGFSARVAESQIGMFNEFNTMHKKPNNIKDLLSILV